MLNEVKHSMRKTLAALVSLGLAWSICLTPGTALAEYRYFADINESVAHADDVLWLALSGISTGWELEDGSREFRPYANVARADMAAFLHRLDALSQREPSPGENELELGQSE